MSGQYPNPFVRELRETQADIEALKQDKADGRWATKFTGGITVLVALIAVASPVVTSLATEDPEPSAPTAIVVCQEARDDALEAARQTGTIWIKLPTTAPLEEQCNINEYVLENEPEG